MTKTPTAEEVLAKLSTACDSYNSEPFIAAYQQWQAAQGAVTREWFIERFGGVYVTCARADIAYWDHDNSVDLIYRSDNEPTVELENPTRSDIETLVRVLGGECNGKDA